MAYIICSDIKIGEYQVGSAFLYGIKEKTNELLHPVLVITL